MTRAAAHTAQARGPARTGPGLSRTSPTASFQDLLDAERWRGQFAGALREADDPAGLHADLVAGVEQRRWVHLKDEKGVQFQSFESFCQAPGPFGLGSSADLVHAFLGELLGSRRAERLTVRPARPGVRTTETSRQNGGRSDRDEHRLRAVQERIPDPVRQLHDLEILSLDQAAWFGPKKPDQDRKQAIERFAERAKEVLRELGDARDEPALAHAKGQVLEALPIPKPSRLEAALRQVQRLEPDELERFLERLQAWLAQQPNPLV
jgi:hypothetical protein